MMKKKIIMFCVIVTVCLTSVVNAQECKILRIGGTTDWLPVAYINKKTGEPEGIAHDFAKIVGEKLNIPFELDATLPWKRMLHYLENGKIDMTAALYKTKEREVLYQFTTDYFKNESRVFVVKGKEFTFEKFEDLIGRVGGLTLGSYGEEFEIFAKQHKLRLERVKTLKQMTKKLLLGRNDYIILDHLNGMLFLKKSGLRGQIIALPYIVSIAAVHIALSRQSPCLALLPQINAIIETSKQDGTLQAIVDRYIK